MSIDPTISLTKIKNDEDYQKCTEGSYKGTKPTYGQLYKLEVGMAAVNKLQKAGINSNTWLGDTGCSCHLTNSMVGMYNYKSISSEVTMGNGKPLKAVKI